MRHILFVDDDPYVLDGLRDALRPRRREWQMTFVAGGEAATAVLERERIDIIVSDLRMPGMDGATLLTKAAWMQPHAIRIVLSGQANPETIGRVSAVAHRILVKPSPIEDVTRVLERSCVLLDVTGEVALIQAAAGACALPSAPGSFLALKEVLGRTNATAAQIAAVVACDMAMSAKVLQLANSAYFGPDQPVLTVSDAVTVLGQETIRGIAFSAGAFQKFELSKPIPGFSLEHLERRSLRVGRLAHLLSQNDPNTGDAFAAGLLLDIGLLVLASHEPEYLGDVLMDAKREGRPVHEIELDRKGITHAEIGAHLFALWGLPHTIVEAVAHHHRPLRSPIPAFDTIAVTHIADALVPHANGDQTDGPSTRGRIDDAYVERIGVTDRIAEWERLATTERATTPA